MLWGSTSLTYLKNVDITIGVSIGRMSKLANGPGYFDTYGIPDFLLAPSSAPIKFVTFRASYLQPKELTGLYLVTV